MKKNAVRKKQSKKPEKEETSARKFKPPSLSRLRAQPFQLAAAALFLIIFVGAILLVNRPDPNASPTDASLKQYAIGTVVAVTSDNTAPDAWTEGRKIGTQVLQIKILTGAHKGAVLAGTNYATAYSGVIAKVGTRLTVLLDNDENGNLIISSVFNYDRGAVLIGVLLVFIALLALIGGKKGVMALLGLAFTLASLWFLLIPLLKRGWPTVPTAVLFVALAAAVSLYVVAGPTKKTLSAIIGCVGGVAAAWLCVVIVDAITPINGFNMNEAESLVLLAKDDGLRISGLLAAGVLIASLGAVIDVSMTIASACGELVSIDPTLDRRRLFRSGMNIGRDAMGAMAATLILAFVGSSLNMLILFRVYDFSYLNIMGSDLVTIEFLQGIGGSIGIVCTVPLVAFVSSLLMVKKRAK